MQGLLLAAVLEGLGIWRVIGGGGVCVGGAAFTNLGNGGTLRYLRGRSCFCVVCVCNKGFSFVAVPVSGTTSP